MKIVDLSVTLVDGLPVDPPGQIPQIEYHSHKDDDMLASFMELFPGLRREDIPGGEAWAVESIRLCTHSGTHMDAPWHFASTTDNGKPAWGIDEAPLEWCIGNGVVVDATDKPDGYVLNVEDFKEYFKKVNYTLKPGDIILLHTNAPTQWGSKKYMFTGCGVGRDATVWLCDQGVHTVGTDAWSWDAPLSLVAKKYVETGDASIIWEGHKAGIERAYLQIEKLANLDTLPVSGFTFCAFPCKIEHASAGWCRAVAIFND